MGLSEQLNQLKSDAQSAGAGLAAKQKAIDEVTDKPLVPVHVQAPTSPVDLLHPGAKYGSRPGEKRIDVSQMTGLSGVNRSK